MPVSPPVATFVNRAPPEPVPDAAAVMSRTRVQPATSGSVETLAARLSKPTTSFRPAVAVNACGPVFQSTAEAPPDRPAL